MAIDLTTPIVQKNITRWSIDAVAISEDESLNGGPSTIPPFIKVGIKAKQPGGDVYGYYTLTIYDSIASNILGKSPNTDPKADKLIVGSGVISGAYTSALNTWNTTSGSRTAKKAALELALLSLGIVQSSLGGTSV